AGSLDIEAVETHSVANASILVVNVTLGLGGAGGNADAEVTRDVKAYIAPEVIVDAHGGTVTVDATSNSVATADGRGGAGSLVASVAALLVNAHVGGSTLSFVGEGATIAAGTLEVMADAVQRQAVATSLVVSISLLADGGGSNTTADVAGLVEAYVGQQADDASVASTTVLDVSGSITIDAKAEADNAQTNATVGVGGALLAVGATFPPSPTRAP